MLQALLAETNEVIGVGYQCERDAQQDVVEFIKKRLESTPKGRRTLGWLKGNVTWKFANNLVILMEMVGVWIETEKGQVVPDETTDDNELVFIDKKGHRYIGQYDSEEALFVTGEGEDEKYFAPERVKAYMVLPDSEEIEK